MTNQIMDSIPPVEYVYRARNKTYAESEFDSFLTYALPYKKHTIPYKKIEQEKKDNELVKKVYASLGIGTRLDLAA